MPTTLDLLVWMMILMRVVGLFILMPVFSHRSIPLVARLALASALAFIVFPLAQVEPGAYPSSVWMLVLWMAKELAVGLSIGLAIKMIFFVLEFAAHIITVEIGLLPSPEFDPSNAASQGNPLGTVIYFFGVVLLLSGSEYDILRAFLLSYEIAPLTHMEPNSFAADFIITKTAGIFKVGILMAAPFIAVNFLINLIFATLGKVVPKLNVFILSFSARIFVGTSVLVASVALLAHYTLNYIADTPETMLRFIFFRPEI